MIRAAIYSLFLFLFVSCKNSPLFQQIPSKESGITFNNKIVETDSVNILDFSNVYNGGGVGIGDFNKDGLPDIYFVGNQVSNKLYLNKGQFKFDDVTKEAQVSGEGRWGRGVTVVDINNDGWDDIYVCETINSNPKERENLLYVNQGLDKNGIPVFKEMAAAYGLNDNSHSTMAVFFDYDKDGDLDCFIAVNEIVDGDYPNRFRPRLVNGEHASTDRLYRNDGDQGQGHPVFTNVSKEAGILIEGYSHQASVADINQDGYPDIFISNDYLSDDILYINNGNGTFTDQSKTYFKHTAANAMGADIVDINNDGLPDVIELDMNPEDNFRKKMMMNANSYQTYQNIESYNYQYQYVRNMLHINQGPRVKANDSLGAPAFSEVSFFAGMAQTDWSWTPMVMDFDNDGFKDIIVTNGFPKDITDHDFGTFRNQAYALVGKKELLAEIPEVKIHNYAFKNNGNLTFNNTSENWGLDAISFSNGAAYADLDNDGDMDLIINNINDPAFIYQNKLRENHPDSSNYIQVSLEGSHNNKKGLGALVEVYVQKKKQVWENYPFRGYLTSVQDIGHFGLGKTKVVDSIKITWPEGKVQILKQVKANQKLVLKYSDAKNVVLPKKEIFAKNTLFTEVTPNVNINYIHPEKDFIDFNIQKLLPHKLSDYGPALAVGDLNGDGLDDFVSGGSATYSAQLFFQTKAGKFERKALLSAKDQRNKPENDTGILLFDADADGDLDLYIASGGYENKRNTPVYEDRLFLNDGKGNFSLAIGALPKNFNSKFCVRAADIDHDGDLDLFVSSRVDPWFYPKPVSSFIFRNDSANGIVKFTDVTKTIAKDLINVGLVSDAVFSDFDNDGWPDLILAGEWMPITFMKNDKGTFRNISKNTGINNLTGGWNSIASGDFDNDGDMDYIVGNMGTNTFYQASKKYPISITAADFDHNGSYDAFPSLYLKDQKGEMKNFPAQTRDDLVKQMISLRTVYQNYRSFANATMDEILSNFKNKNPLKLQINDSQSSYIRNDGGGKFSISPLPGAAQISVLNGIAVGDWDGDQNLDVAINGNDYGSEVSVGRYDALNGLVLKGDGKGSFTPLSILQSGLYIPENGKALVKLRNAKGGLLLAASQNRGPFKVFEQKHGLKNITILPDDVSALITFKNGKKRKQEFYYGSSFLSQSGRFLTIPEQTSVVYITNTKGIKRKVL
nr:VCBS repeat-containing protein [Pseudopedobacter sp.]